MPSIVRRQRTNPVKLGKAKEFRRNMTPEETIVWDRLRGNKLNGLHFRRQQVIAGYIVDFYCHSARLIVEIDGEIHERRKMEDQKRDQILMEKGLRVLRIQNQEVRIDIQKVLGVILEVSKR